MMDGYLLLKVIHVLSATLLLGTGFGTAFYMWSAHRHGEIPVIAHVSQRVVLADWWFTTPAVILQPITGYGMLWLSGQSLSQLWIVLSLVLYLIAGLCWLPVVWLQLRIRDISLQAVARNAETLPDSYQRYMRIWVRLGWPAFAAVIGIYYLMVFKLV